MCWRESGKRKMNAEQKAIKAIWSIVLIESKIVIYSESFWQPAATLCFQSLLKTVYHDKCWSCEWWMCAKWSKCFNFIFTNLDRVFLVQIFSGRNSLLYLVVIFFPGRRQEGNTSALRSIKDGWERRDGKRKRIFRLLVPPLCLKPHHSYHRRLKIRD